MHPDYKKLIKMKRVLLLFLLALSIVPSQAQRPFSKKNVDNEDLHLGAVKWGERKLRWDDFRAVNPTKGRTSSYVSLEAIPKEKEKILNGIKYKYIGWENYVIQNNSWLDVKNMNESKLKHCQNQFDLWEFLVRKVAVEYPRKQNVSLDAQYSEMQRAFDEEIDRMNIVTNQGNNAQAVDSIADELAKKLTDEELDPRDLVRGLVPSKVYWMGDMGIIASVPFSDYQGTSYGVSFGASYNRCKRLYGLDIDMSFFSKCKKQILAKKGHIEEGDWPICGAITSYFGYNVYNRDKVALTPFIGVGVRFFDGGERYEEYIKNKNRKHVMYECAGFSTGLGMMIDYKLKHTINSRFKYMGIDATETQLRVKPYISVTRYGDGIGWVPAINLAVGVNTKTYRMKEK